MKIVDLLALLVRDDERLSPRDRADARELIRELRRINAFGSAVNGIDVKHTCQPVYHAAELITEGPTKGGWSGAYYDCLICGRNMPECQA